MTTYMIAASADMQTKLAHTSMRAKRLLVFLLIVGLAFIPGELGVVVQGSLAEAYLQVSVFVAGTLFLVYGLERLFKFDIGVFNASHPNLQVAVSALLGALPGCGGAIIVLTQFVHRQVSFGAVIAALTATMGDAAFLLLAKEPQTGLAIILLSLSAGAVFGWLVDQWHGRGFMQIDRHKVQKKHNSAVYNLPLPGAAQRAQQFLSSFWLLLLIPGILLGILGAFQLDLDVVLSAYALPFTAGQLGFLGAVLTLLLWGMSTESACSICSNPQHVLEEHLQTRVLHDTTFITVWVVVAFLTYELLVFGLALDLKTWFAAAGWTLPLIALLVGFIPGCGPQIVVTSLYVNGLVPLSAQIANAISNDGDALFPAISVAPKAAILATLYSAVPAAIFGYGYYAFFEI